MGDEPKLIMYGRQCGKTMLMMGRIRWEYIKAMRKRYPRTWRIRCWWERMRGAAP